MTSILGAGDGAVKRQRTTLDPETGELLTWDEAERSGDAARLAYDQDAADLERWMLHGYARRALFAIEERAVRVRVPYSEFAWYTRLSDRVLRSAPVRERYRVEEQPAPAFTRLADREVISAEQRRAARFRVINCCRDKIGRDTAPEVWLSEEARRASYHKVAVCGSVWTCPVCSRRINLARQAHIRAAYELFVTRKPELRAGVRDGDAVMVTFTIRHGVGDELVRLFDQLKGADRRQQKAYAYKRLVGYARTVKGQRVRVPSVLDYVGRVTATEVTYGANGWHPHLHQLWFFDRRLTGDELEELRAALFATWSEACQAEGLPAPREFVRGKAVGVDVRRALSAEEYLTKFGHERQWAPERELAAQHAKRSKGGRTAFQLLHDYSGGDAAAGALFRVFAEATLGRHQLQWSRGLRERLVALGLDDILESDEALAASRDEGSRLLGTLDDDDWEALLGADRYGIEAHGTTLAIAKRAGFEAAVAFLRSLPSYVAHRARRAHVDDVARYAVDAVRERARFWLEVDLRDGVPDLESEAEGVAYINDPREAARAWRALRRSVEGRGGLSPEREP